MPTLTVYRSGHFEHNIPLEQISDLLPDKQTLIWLDVESPDEADVALLAEEFGFHALSLEDATRHHERPKIEAYENYYFIVFYHAVYNAEECEILLQSINLFVGANYLVSVHQGPCAPITLTLARWNNHNYVQELNAGALLHGFLDGIVDDYFPIMDQITDQVEDLEDRIFSRFDPDNIEQIFRVKKALITLRRVVGPERDVLNVLLRGDLQLYKRKELAYLQDVYDHLVRVTDGIDVNRDLLSSALDSFLSLQSNRLNEIVKVLTITSIILMSAALIAGIYGMNFMHMPELAWPFGYPFALGLMLVVAVGLGLFFRSRRWW